MNSIEKIHALAQEYEGPPGPDSEPLELMLRTAIGTLGPMFLSVLPQEPAELDEAIDEMATRLLQLKSDEPQHHTIDATAEPAPQHVLEAGE